MDILARRDPARSGKYERMKDEWLENNRVDKDKNQ